MSDNAKKTPGQYWAEMRDQRKIAFGRLETDGPLIGLLKAIFSFRAFHEPVELFVKARLGNNKTTDIEMGTEPAKSEFNKYVEWYWILWTILLVFIYFLSLLACHFGSSSAERGSLRIAISVVLTLLSFVIAIFRIFEILAVSFRLHLLGPYKTSSPPHAMVLTFLAYVHALLGFAAMYLAESYWFGDHFTSCQGLWTNWVDALYFSTVTITTVGYGDLSPEVSFGKLLVILEIFIGLILVVIAVQRVLAGFDFSPKEDEGRRSESSTDPGETVTPTDS